MAVEPAKGIFWHSPTGFNGAPTVLLWYFYSTIYGARSVLLWCFYSVFVVLFGKSSIGFISNQLILN
jgi:hypothetical protein